jgi:hypothetical protein
MVKRYAVVKNADSREQVEAYLPGNYEIIHEYESADDPRRPLCFVIAGRDNAGWGLNSYVIPRCASGLIWVTEIDLSHSIMKEIPA